MFAAATVDGVSSARLNIAVAAGSASHLRVERSGDTWTFAYSADGTTWTTAGSFSHALAVAAVGPFAAATGGAPGHTAQVDWFFDTAAPIAAEDAGLPVAPVAADDTAATVLGTALVLDVAADLLANDSDADGDPLSLAGFTQPASGSVVDSGDGTLTYTPAAGFIGSDSFTYTVSDGGLTDTATVTIEVIDAANTAPAAGDDTVTTDEDTAAVITVAGLLANDGDGDGDALTLAGVTQPAHGTTVIDDNGTPDDAADDTVVYTPAADFHGSDAFTYTVADGRGGSATATVAVTVTPVNDAPLAQDDTAATTADTALVLAGADLLANDSDADGDALTLAGVTQPAHGTAAIDDNGTPDDAADDRIVYTPAAGFTGSDSFTYTVSDGTATDSATVAVTVDPPLAIVSDDFSAAALDPMWARQGPAGTATTAVADGEGYLEITVPAGDYDAWGSNRGTRVLQDAPDGDFGIAARFLSAPTQRFQMQGLLVEQDAGNWLRFDTYHDGSNQRVFAAVTVDGVSAAQINTGVAAGSASHLRVERSGNNWTLAYSADGATWTPAGSFSHAMAVTQAGVFAGNTAGASGFTAQVDYVEVDSDPLAAEDPPNAAPVPADDVVATGEGAALTIDVAADLLANDSDPEGAAVSLAGFDQPTHGVLIDNGDGTLTYTPDPGFHGFDGFDYAVSDGENTATGGVRIDVMAAGNAAPVAVADSVAAAEDAPVVIAPLANDTDADGDTPTLIAFSAAAHGVLADNGDNTLTYTPDPDFNGTDSFGYTIHDGRGGTAEGTVTITVAAVNDAPTPADDVFQAFIDTPLTINVAELLANDADPEGDALSLAGFDQPAHGVVVDNGDGTLSYTPESGFQGGDGFVYRVSDGQDIAAANVAIGVTPAAGFFSDDFSGAFAYADWRFEGPAGTAEVLKADAEGYLELKLPTGVYDLWNGAKDAARFMQTAVNVDFEIEAKFLSTPQQKTQMQGILVEQDEDDWIRFDILHNGTQLQAFAAVTEGGASRRTAALNLQLPEVPHIRVDRTGDQWHFEVSSDGADWIEAGSFTHALTVTSVGPFAASASGAPGYVAQVDYFENAADPVSDDSTIPGPPVAREDLFSVPVNTSFTIDIAADLLINDTDQNGDPILFVEAAQPAHGIIVDNGDGTLTYTPTPDYLGPDSFAYTITDGDQTSVGTATISVASPAMSDDFSGGPLDSVWLYEGMDGFAQIATTETDGFVEIYSPPGIKLSVSGVLTAPRLLQTVVDEDFQVSAGFLTEPSQQYQEHGFLFIQDDLNWVRFDLAYTGSTLTLIVGVIEDGVTRFPLFSAIGSGAAQHMRVTRSGDEWVFERSGDGQTWSQAYSMTQAMTVSKMGLFAGSSAASGGEVPGYTAQVDYFENSATPILDEDGVIVPTNVAPMAEDDSFRTDVDAVLTLDVASDLMGNDRDGNGDAITLTGFTQPARGNVIDNADGTLTYVPKAGFRGTDSFTYTISDGVLADTATVDVTVANPIDVWYGSEQHFGTPGATQKWANILGSISVADVVGLSYTLNDGPSRALVIGSDGRRLDRPGDFNIELDYAELDPGPDDDVVVISAQRADGSVLTEQVTIAYEAGNRWSPNHAIDWSTVTNLQDVVQVVDGLWEFDGVGVTPARPGYDRLLTMGDAGWDNYEVNLSVTMNDLQSASPRHGGLFAFGFMWNGHTDSPVPGYDPHAGWENSAGIYFWGEDEVSIDRYEGWGGARQNLYSFSEGETYNFKARIEQYDIYDRLYKVKIWTQDEAEPTDWLIESVDRLSAPATGSFVLNSHFESVTFHDIAVTEIVGNDITAAGAGNDVVIAVDPGASRPGLGEIDVLRGGGGSDILVLGDSEKVYYDDGDDSTDGTEDFAFVWDFETGVDRIRLHGDADMYELGPAPTGIHSGDALYLKNSLPGGPNELVAVFNGTIGNFQDFDFV